MTGQEALRLKENLKTFDHNEKEIEDLKGFLIDLRDVNAKKKEHKIVQSGNDESVNTFYDIVKIKISSAHSRYEQFSTNDGSVVKAIIKDINQNVTGPISYCL